MALILNIEEGRAIVLSIDSNKLIKNLRDQGCIATVEGEDTEAILVDTLKIILDDLICSIVPTPNYELGGTQIVFGGPEEILIEKRKNRNLPYLNSSSGL